jgi:hypothetical protein
MMIGLIFLLGVLSKAEEEAAKLTNDHHAK